MAPTTGYLGVIGCPILAEEIVYSVKRDDDISRVYVIESEDSRDLLRKLEASDSDAEILPINMDELDSLPQDGFNLLIFMQSMGLHEDPQKLRKGVENAISVIGPVCKSVVLFYGLCGNAFKDTSELERETGRRLTLLSDKEGRPVDDCIAAVLGGTDGYLRLLKRYPGVFYLTPGWAENWRELIYKMEMTRGMSRNDLSTLKWLFELAGYKKALKLDTGLCDRDAFEQHVDDFVREFKFEKATLEKEFITLDAVERSYERAKRGMTASSDK